MLELIIMRQLSVVLGLPMAQRGPMHLGHLFRTTCFYYYIVLIPYHHFLLILLFSIP